MSQKEFHFIDENGETQNVPASEPKEELFACDADYAGLKLTAVLANNAGHDEAQHKKEIRKLLRAIARAWGLKVTGED